MIVGGAAPRGGAVVAMQFTCGPGTVVPGWCGPIRPDGDRKCDGRVRDSQVRQHGNRAIAETVMPAAPATMPSRAPNDAASSSAPTKFHPTTGATGSALTQGAGPPHRGVGPPAPIPMPLARCPISCRRGVRNVWAAAAPGRHLPMTVCRNWVGGPSATRPPPTSRPSSRDRYSNTRCSGRREPAWQPR